MWYAISLAKRGKLRLCDFLGNQQLVNNRAETRFSNTFSRTLLTLCFPQEPTILRAKFMSNKYQRKQNVGSVTLDFI